MQLPAEIAIYLTPDKLKHVGDGLEHYMESRVGGLIGARLFKAARRRLLPFLDRYDDIELIKQRLQRIDDFVTGFQSEFSRTPESLEIGRISDEQTAKSVDDPAYDDFVSEACEAAMQSPDDAMRLLLGRITALRTSVPTSSVPALQLQEALTLTQRVSARQLWALTVVYMLTRRAMAPPLAPLKEVEAYLDREYYPVLAYLAEQRWNKQDLQHLVFLSALSLDQTYELMEQRQHSRFRTLFRAGGEYWPVPQGEPIGGNFLNLADEFDSEGGHNGRSVGPYTATPVGATLGGIVYDQLHDQLVGD